jgi:hypothetical protein
VLYGRLTPPYLQNTLLNSGTPTQFSAEKLQIKIKFRLENLIKLYGSIRRRIRNNSKFIIQHSLAGNSPDRFTRPMAGLLGIASVSFALTH